MLIECLSSRTRRRMCFRPWASSACHACGFAAQARFYRSLGAGPCDETPTLREVLREGGSHSGSVAWSKEGGSVTQLVAWLCISARRNCRAGPCSLMRTIDPFTKGEAADGSRLEGVSNSHRVCDVFRFRSWWDPRCRKSAQSHAILISACPCISLGACHSGQYHVSPEAIFGKRTHRFDRSGHAGGIRAVVWRCAPACFLGLITAPMLLAIGLSDLVPLESPHPFANQATRASGKTVSIVATSGVCVALVGSKGVRAHMVRSPCPCGLHALFGTSPVRRSCAPFEIAVQGVVADHKSGLTADLGDAGVSSSSSGVSELGEPDTSPQSGLLA